MADSLRLTFKEVYVKVAEYLGLGSSPTGTDLTTVKDIVKRAYREFLMPIDASTGTVYRWHFLQRTTTLSCVSGVDTYDLPTGFSRLVIPFTHTTPLSYNPVEKDLEYMYLIKSQTTGNGYPVWFAIKVDEFDQVTGQKTQVVFYPTPSSSFDYYYTYLVTPPAPVNDDEFFIGDEYASECILEKSLAVAEISKHDEEGGHSAKAERLLQSAIGEDKKKYYIPNLGQMRNGKMDEYTRSALVYDKTSTQILPSS